MITEAVGIAVHSVDPERQKRLEDAMMAAVQKAQAEGETDPEAIRELILKARDGVLGK